jgi:hypothetical protein
MLISDHDIAGALCVAVINQTVARHFFPNEDPIGKRIHVTNGLETFREIVGDAGDVKHYGLDREIPLQTYEPCLQRPFSSMIVVLRGAKVFPGG